MNRQYKEIEIRDYLAKPPAFGGIALGLYGFMTFMEKNYQRLSSLINRLKSRAQFHRDRSHLDHHNRVSQPRVVNPK